MITELRYAGTNTYLIKGKDKYFLFDTDLAGTFSLFCKAIKKQGITVQDIGIFMKEKRSKFIPIDDSRVKIVNISDSRSFLNEIGIGGEIIHTPGHSDDSISLYLDDGSLFVGD